MTTTRPRVLVSDPIAENGLEALADHCDVDVRLDLGGGDLSGVIGDYDALVVGPATTVTAGDIAAAGRLSVIGRVGAGLDGIDTKAAVDRGITVVNTPDANTVAVAELTLGLMLALARNVPQADAAMKAGRWDEEALVGTGLAGRTLGIVGFGRIGQEVAVRARAFGMTVVTNQRRPTPELYLEAGVTPLDLYDLLAQADFVSLHVPANSETDGMIGSRELRTMKPTAYLVNTSRGAVVDESALLRALDDGAIAGAGLDVFAVEPAVDNVVATHPSVIATPHIGARTTDAQSTAAMDIASKILRVLGTSEPAQVLPLLMVSMDDVVPHETVDTKRTARLAERIRTEGILRNPPLASRVGDQYVVLDGATRSDALRHMGFQHAVIQEVSVDDGVDLETWQHVVRSIDTEDLLTAMTEVPGVRLDPVEAHEAAAHAIEYGGLCSVITVDGRAFVVYGAAEQNRFDALASFAAAYVEASTVSRTLERNLRTLTDWYPDMVALVEYPQFTVEQVLLAAGSGRLLPAGVTRFLISGRVLRLDLPLERLASEEPLELKNAWLQEHLAEKERHGKIRYYREPVYVLDE